MHDSEALGRGDRRSLGFAVTLDGASPPVCCGDVDSLKGWPYSHSDNDGGIMEGRLQRDDGGIMEGRLQKEPVHQCPLELWQSCAASAHATLPAAFGYVALAVND